MTTDVTPQATGHFLAGGGEMGALIRDMDWSKTSLGPIATWPQSLRTTLSVCLNSRFPILIFWGQDLIKLYNDAYRPILGATKHPRALGAPGREIWPEIWPIIGPMLRGVIEQGEATWSNDLLLVLDRNSYPEECYFTFSYSPIWDESGGIGGVFTAVNETTERVIGERRLRTLRELATETAKATTGAAACAISIETLGHNPVDLPFVLLYLLDADGKVARLAGATGLPSDSPAAPPRIDLAASGRASAHWPLRDALTIGHQIAFGVERKKAEEATRRRLEQHKQLAEIATRINVANDVTSVLKVITEEARNLIGSHQSVTSLTVGQDWRQAINVISLTETYQQWQNYAAQPDGSGIYSLVARQNQPMRLTQAELEAHPAWKGFGAEAANHPPLRG